MAAVPTADMQALLDLLLPRIDRAAAAAVEAAARRQPGWRLMPASIDPDSQRGAVCAVEADDSPGELVEVVRLDPRQGVPDAGEGSRTRTLLLTVPGGGGYALGIIPDDSDDPADSPPTLAIPAVRAAAQAGSYDFTITSYGVASSAGSYSDCGVAFVAAASGRAVISLAGQLSSATGNTARVAPVVRTGDVVGSGTLFLGALDDNAVEVQGSSPVRAGVDVCVEGLTGGAVYNVRLEHKASAGTGTAVFRSVIVTPDLGVATP